MHKFRVIILILLVASLLSAGLLPASASTPQNRAPSLPSQTLEIVQLARYMPASTAVFAAIRIDDDYLASLEAIIELVASRIPGASVPERPLRTALDMILKPGGISLEKDIRPWLGKHAAVGVSSLASLVMGSRMGQAGTDLVIAVEITDRVKAEAFVEKLLAFASNPQFTKSSLSGFTFYHGTQYVSTDMLIGDSVLLIGTKGALNTALGRGDALSDSKTFNATLSKLPAPSYNLQAYLDLSSLAALLNSETIRTGGGMFLGALWSAIGPIAIGGTILEDRSLTLDTVQYIYPEGLAGWGYQYPYSKPVNPAFVSNLPAGTSALVHQTDLKGIADLLMAIARISEEGRSFPEPFETRLQQMKDRFQSTTGLDLDADVLSWMTGDYALFLSYNADAPNPLLAMMLNEPFSMDAVGGGIIIEATDPAKARLVAEKLGAALVTLLEDKVPNLEGRQETVEGIPATVFRVKDDRLSTPFEIVIGANDKVFVIATRAAAESIFSGEPGLDTTAAYKDAAGFFLEMPTQVLYLAPSGFDLMGLMVGMTGIRQMETIVPRLVVTPIGATPEPTPTVDPDAAAKRRAEMVRNFEEGMKVIKGITSLFAHAAITGNYTDGGAIVGRASITLSKAE